MFCLLCSICFLTVHKLFQNQKTFKMVNTPKERRCPPKQKPLYLKAKCRRRLLDPNSAPRTPTRHRRSRNGPPSDRQEGRSRYLSGTPDSKTTIPEQAFSMKPFHKNAKNRLIGHWRRIMGNFSEQNP